MSKDWLPSNESVIEWEGRPSVVAGIESLLGGGVLVAAGVGGVLFEYLTVFGSVSAIVVGVVIAVLGVGKVIRTEYVITRDSVWKRKSLFGTDTTRVEIGDVQNVSYNRSMIGGVTGKGNVVIDVAGGEDIHFNRVSGYQKAQSLITELASKKTGKSEIPGSVQQWQEIRAEIKALREDITGSG
jgi:uncharacterized membrane protein YdbT with pleckstrin-like domain